MHMQKLFINAIMEIQFFYFQINLSVDGFSNIFD